MAASNNTISPEVAQNVIKGMVTSLVLAAPAAHLVLKTVGQAIAHWESQRNLVKQKDREIAELRRELNQVRWRQRPM